MSEKKPAMYAYLWIACGIVILGFSMMAMMEALTAFQAGQTTEFFAYGIAATVGTAFGLSTVTQMRRKMVAFQNVAARVLSVVVCASCGFKVVRTFSVGDFVPKEVGQCQQCKGSMRVDAIYSEEPKKA